MKIVCTKSNLLNGVQIVSKAVPSKTTMSILECILVDTRSGEIKLTANDMELGIETTIDGEIIDKGIIALDAKIFLEIVRKLPDNDITIETSDSYKTTITCEKAKFYIIGKSGEDFSFLPEIERNDSVIVSQFTLKEVIRQTIFSISDNDNNKLMTGELFEINNNTLKIVSLDGHRISIRKIRLKNPYETKVKINKKELLNCIDRATLLVKEGDKKPIIISISDTAMELKMNSTVGSMDEEIDINKEGKDLMIGFNPKFLIDSLRVIEDEEVDLYMVNPKAPCFIRNAEETYIYVILPVNFTTVN